MAFQRPLVPAPSRPALPRSEENQPGSSNVLAQQARPTEWLLFPNVGQHSPSCSPTVSTNYSPQTAGLSRLSEFGSLYTAALPSTQTIPDDALEDDELDSLDDGLHAFREEVVDRGPAQLDQTGSILPTHDGLGTFPGSSHPVQEHLWQFERFNPQRREPGHHRRHSSVQRRLDALDVDDVLHIEKERMERIEKWRLEHSRIMLEEVEAVTRRSSGQPERLSKTILPDTYMEADTGSIHESMTALKKSQIHSRENNAAIVQHAGDGWHRIVRMVIEDMIGINDTTFAIIFGEALAESDTRPRYDSSAFSSNPAERRLALQSTRKWTVTLLDCLSKELVSVLRRLAYSPAAVGSPINRVDLDYAGIPVGKPYIQPSAVPPVHETEQVADVASTPTPLFNPTLNERHESTNSDFGHAALWGIEEESTDTVQTTQDREYWEQTPSIRTIFRLLHQHFTTRRRPLLTSGTVSSKQPSNVAITSTADSIRRAAVIRQQHPLVSRQGSRRKATSNMLGHSHRHHGNYSNLSSSLFKRSESSCASISARKSKRGSGSSRNYWDFRGSGGSGSMGGMGAWGEV
ncbi:MAG: hypothetical protein Q9168_004450 [Polycauliona sp. 1 TL-2023]